jgi:hypothetical protein
MASFVATALVSCDCQCREVCQLRASVHCRHMGMAHGIYDPAQRLFSSQHVLIVMHGGLALDDSRQNPANLQYGQLGSHIQPRITNDRLEEPCPQL